MLEVLKIVYLLLGAGLSVYLIWLVLQSKRRLDRRMEEFLTEQAENPGPPPNPWLALAELYAEDERKNREARAKRKRG